MAREVQEPRDGCDICEVVADLDDDFVIEDGRYWVSNLRQQDQTLLGASFITLKRHAPELDSLTFAEDFEFRMMRNGLIRAMRASFNPITINVSCLKNDAFRTDPDNTPYQASHVHWHLKPRYGTEPIVIGDEAFYDPAPGRYLPPGVRHPHSLETALSIAATLRANLPDRSEAIGE